MKITNITPPTPPPFSPVTMQIVCESQDELDAICTIIQTLCIDKALKRVWPSLHATEYAMPLVRNFDARTRCSEFTAALRASLPS